MSQNAKALETLADVIIASGILQITGAVELSPEMQAILESRQNPPSWWQYERDCQRLGKEPNEDEWLHLHGVNNG